MGELKINTLFRWCNDVNTMRVFYTDLLDLTETYFQDNEQHGWLTYDANGVQLVFMRGTEKLPITVSGWAKQPSYKGGTEETSSWLLTTKNQAEFQEIVQRLQEANVPLNTEIDSSRQCFALDPMDWTIEIGIEVE